MKSYLSPPKGMTLSDPICRIHNRTNKSVTLVINASIPGITITGGLDICRRVPSISLGDKTVYAIEPQPDEIKVDSNWVHLIYK